MKKFFFFLFICAFSGLLHAEVLWQADFTQAPIGGFTLIRQAEGDSASAGAGELKVTFKRQPRPTMSLLSQDIPMPERGELSFEMMLNAGKSKNFHHWSLQFFLFGNMFAWNGDENWGFCAYRLKPKEEFIRLAKPEMGVWVPVKIRFDRTKSTVQYFINDLYTPAKTLEGLTFKSTTAGKGAFQIANYGYASGPMTHRLRNLKLESIEDTQAADNLLWQETFSKDGSLTDNGYEKQMDNGKDSFQVKDGVLTMICQNSPYKGTTYRKKIPVTACCEFSFEAMIAASGTGLYNHLSLKIQFGNLLMSFRHPNWHIHRPSKNDWFCPGKVTENTWHLFKIRFDATKHTAEYYIDDMATPVHVDTECEFDPAKSSILSIGNYGLPTGTIINCLRNLKVTRYDNTVSDVKKKIELKGTMVLKGICFDKMPIEQLTGKYGGKPVATYHLELMPHHVYSDDNHYSLYPIPPTRPEALPKCIILADMPLNAIPAHAQLQMKSAIEEGAVMIVLGRYFTLNKGFFAGSDFEAMMPVSVKDPWKHPEPLPNCESKSKNGQPSVVSRTVGKGRVIVVLDDPLSDDVASLL